MLSRLLLVAALALPLAGTLPAVEPGTPEATVALPAEALRTNDLVGLFRSMPSEKQAEARAKWQAKATTATAQEKAEFDEKMALLLAPDAVDRLMAMAQPSLAQLNPLEMAGGVQMIGGMMAMQMAQKDQKLGQTLQLLVADLAAWLPTSGIEDPAKLRQALTAVTAAAKALGVRTSDEAMALDLEEFLVRAGAALKEGKQALTPYGIDVDAFLGSLRLADINGSGDQRTAQLEMQLFGKPYRFPATLKRVDGNWQFDASELQQQLAPMTQMGPGGGM